VSNNVAASYLDQERLPFPFCRGCSHGRILHHLDAALGRLGLEPRQVVIVTDIGCVGLSDRFFATNTFHGLHGRSITYATGIKLAHPELTVVVLMGDGGAGIGGNHLIHAARRNIGITVLVFNNFNFGMTGGQHSPTTPPGARTPTTLTGQIEQPLDICGTVATNGAGFVARALFSDPALPDLIESALRHDGFALLDIWEMCIRYARANRAARERLPAQILKRGDYPSGVLQQNDRPEYTQAYREATSLGGLGPKPSQSIVSKFRHGSDGPVRCLLAGTAGGRVRSTATLFGLGGVLSGLWATQRDEYPVTVASGHSVSQVILSPQEIHYTGISQPDWAVVLTPDGLTRAAPLIARMNGEGRLYLREDLWPVETGAQVILLDLSRNHLSGEKQALAGLAAALRHSELYPLEALREAIRLQGTFVESNLALVEMGANLPLRTVATGGNPAI